MPSLDFMRMYASQNTVRSYRLAVKSLLQVVYQQDVTNDALDSIADRYVQEEGRNRQKDVEEFLVAIKDRPPKTVRLFIAAVKTFLLENSIELPQVFWRRLGGRIRGSRALTLDKVPSNLELRKVLQHMAIQGKALFLVLASSGMRIGEALQLKLGDIDLSTSPVKISIRGDYTKTGNSRIVFFSMEAKEAVEEWLKVRSDYLKAASGRTPESYKKSIDDPRLFPFTDNNAYTMWYNALKKAGLSERDSSTNNHTMHPHVLRKFFRTKLGAVLPIDIVECLMGHEGYLTEVYRRYSQEDLAEFYKKGEGALLVFTNGAEVAKLRAEIEEKNAQLQTIINGLATENITLKEKVTKLEKQNEEINIQLVKLDATKFVIEQIMEVVNYKGPTIDEVIAEEEDSRMKRG